MNADIKWYISVYMPSLPCSSKLNKYTNDFLYMSHGVYTYMEITKYFACLLYIFSLTHLINQLIKCKFHLLYLLVCRDTYTTIILFCHQGFFSSCSIYKESDFFSYPLMLFSMILRIYRKQRLGFLRLSRRLEKGLSTGLKSVSTLKRLHAQSRDSRRGIFVISFF